MIYLSLLSLFCLSTVLTYCYIEFARRKNWLDRPCQRSSHVVPTPRGGGLVFTGLWLGASILALLFQVWNFDEALVLLPGVCLVASTGFYDDRHSLSAKVRAFLYFTAALTSLFLLGRSQGLTLGLSMASSLNWIGFLIALFAIVWSVNLFNFMDGIDGIAGIEALFTVGIGGFFLWSSGGQGLALISWFLVASVAGFLVWNKPPARLFMGDVGSTSLGFTIMILAILGEKQYGIPFTLWLILYGVFLFDATVTLIRRILAKETWYEAHRSHAYQRLNQGKWSHKRVVFGVSVVNAALGLLAILGFYHREYIPFLGLLAFLLLTCLYIQIEKFMPMFPKTSKS